MNRMKRYFTLALVLTMCLTAFSGCSRRNDTVTDPTTQPTNTPATQEDTMGLINYVSDSSVAISVYTTEEDMTDLSAIDPNKWTATDTTRYIPVDDKTEYYRAEGTNRISISKDDLAVGDFITAATVDGVLQITRIAADDTDRGDNTTDNEAVPTAIPNNMTEQQAEDKQT